MTTNTRPDALLGFRCNTCLAAPGVRCTNPDLTDAGHVHPSRFIQRDNTTKRLRQAFLGTQLGRRGRNDRNTLIRDALSAGLTPEIVATATGLDLGHVRFVARAAR